VQGGARPRAQRVWAEHFTVTEVEQAAPLAITALELVARHEGPQLRARHHPAQQSRSQVMRYGAEAALAHRPGSDKLTCLKSVRADQSPRNYPMQKLSARMLGAFLVLPVLAMAQSTLDGTWKIDLGQAQLPQKPDVYLLQQGVYECKSCVPLIRVKANGEEQKVRGSPYFDKISVEVLDDHSITTTRSRDGSPVSTEKMTVAADGTTARSEFSDSSATNAAPVTGGTEMTRVSNAPAGSHLISGSWRTTKFANVSDNALMFTYKTQGDVLSMSTPTGQSFAVKMDGAYAAYNGDPGTTSVSIHRIDRHTFQETDKRGAKVVSVTRMSVGGNGTSLKMVIHDTVHGTTTTLVAEKQ